MAPPADNAPGPGLDAELAALERRLEALLGHARELRAANDALRRDLAAAAEQNRSLEARVGEARERLDALLARLPME
jgi:chromosome segregation ATPase